MDPRLVFLEVVERGSFTAAAEALDISLSYASRRVRTLEQELGVSLLARTTRRVQPTPAGVDYAERLGPLLRGLEELDREVAHEPVEPSGTLRLALPQSFGLVAIQPLLVAFQQRWPGVVIEASFSDRLVDPLDHDVTVRGGALQDSSLVARKLVAFRVLLTASPAYLQARGTPATVDDLAEHDGLSYTAHRTIRPWLVDGREVRPRDRFRADSGDALVAAAIAGLGIAYQPEFLVGPALADGRLVRVLPDAPTWEGAFWAIHRTRVRSRTVAAFVDHLAVELPRLCFGNGHGD